MRTIDFSPLYRSAIGFDHLASLLDATARAEQKRPSYPPYNIEAMDENNYRITMAVAGFDQHELNIEQEKNTLTITGKKPETTDETRYLHRGIATRNFEQQFQLAEHILVRGASVSNGLLTIELEREIPEELKPRTIQIRSDDKNVLEATANKVA